MESADFLRYGIKAQALNGIGPKVCMESIRREECTLMRDAMPSQSDEFHAPHFAR
jgi:hypothetical protein